MDRRERAVPYSVPTGLLSEYLRHGATLSGARGVVPAGVAPQHGDPVTLWTWSKMVRRIVLAANLVGSPLIPRRTLLDRSGPDWLGTTCDRHVRRAPQQRVDVAVSEAQRIMLADGAIQRLVIDEDEQNGCASHTQACRRDGGPDAALTKGYLMAYSMLRAVRTAEGSTVRVRPLALWTVVVSRWPTLGDHLPRERRALCARQFRELRHLFLLLEFRSLISVARVNCGAFVT